MSSIHERPSWLRAWDSLTGIALVYVALITPFEVGFAEANHVGLFVINRLVDVVFCVDIVLQFFFSHIQLAGAERQHDGFSIIVRSSCII